VLASVLLFLLSVSWSVVTPAFRGPDELQHVNSVLRLAEGGGWPPPQLARIEDEVGDAATLAGLVAPTGAVTVFPNGTGDVPPDAALFADVAPPDVDERASFHEMDDGPYRDGGIDQMTQHPPGYYAVVAAIYSGLGAAEWRYDHAIFLMRALTALMVALFLPMSCYVAGRAMTGRPSVGAAAAFVPLLIPELHFVAGMVTNDGATIACTAVMWAAAMVILASGPTNRRLLVLGVAAGLACWTKGTAVALLPVVPVVVLLAYRRERGGTLRSWVPPALFASAWTLAVAFVLGGWWWAVNLLRYGRVQPSGYPTAPRADDPIAFADFVVFFLQRLRWTFFGEMGGREPPPLHALTATLSVAFVVLCAVGLVLSCRRAERLVIVLGSAATVGVLFATTYSAHLQTGNFPGIQGRYLFGLLVPIAVLFTLGLIRLGKLVRLPSAVWPPVLSFTAVGVGLLGVTSAFRIFYVVDGRRDGESVDLFLAWSAWSPAALWGLVAAGVAVVLLLAVIFGRDAYVTRSLGHHETEITQTARST